MSRTLLESPTSIRYAVMDKSFLQGCTHHDLELVTQSRRLVVTMEHYIEVCTGNSEGLLRKLHKLSAHVDLLDHIGTLYKYEIENRQPCTPVANHFRGQLNPSFSLQFTNEQWTAINAERDHIETWSSNVFAPIVREIEIKNPGLERLDVCDADTIRTIYNRLRGRSSKLPEPELIDEHWAVYRQVQVDLIAAADYLKTFDGKIFHLRQERIRHDQIDFRICIVAALIGGLATRDKRMIRYFQTVCPQGDVVQ